MTSLTVYNDIDQTSYRITYYQEKVRISDMTLVMDRILSDIISISLQNKTRSANLDFSDARFEFNKNFTEIRVFDITPKSRSYWTTPVTYVITID